MRRFALVLAPLLGLFGCAVGDDDDSAPLPEPPCEYPAGATEPMAVGSVLTPYYWSEAFNPSRQSDELDVAVAYCDEDPDIEWSPFDVLLFVSIPAW